MIQPFKPETNANRTLIMGCDGLGALVATTLSESGYAVCILDSNPAAFVRLPSSKIEDGQIVLIVGDGTNPQDLEQASIEDTNVFIALSDSDSKNAMAGQIAKHVYEVPKVICRIDDPALKKMYNDLDIVAISATDLVAQIAINEATV